MVLSGTLPVRPFDNTRAVSYGNIHGGSGHPPRVLALAINETGGVILLNLVGYKTACSSHGARLMMNGKLLFTPLEADLWPHETTLTRLDDSHYQEMSAPLSTIRMVNYLTLTRAAHMTQGMRTPPVFPEPKKSDVKESTSASLGEQALDEDEDTPEIAQTTQPIPIKFDLSGALPRYLFGNVSEPSPARKTFYHALAALRVGRYRDTRTPAGQALTDVWTDVLWTTGIEASLITQMPALGIQAWRVSGNLQAWADVVQQNLTNGRLPRLPQENQSND